MSETTPRDPVARLREFLDLEEPGARTSTDIFVGRSQPMPSGRIFGGQVLGQSVIAASRTLPDPREPHSFHGYFLRPGDATKPVTFAVSRIHDGRSFARRAVQAYQDGTPIFSSICSFQDDDPGFSHQLPMPEGLPQPEHLPDPADTYAEHPMSGRLLRENPVEVRHANGDIWLTVDEPSPTQAVWTRVRGELGGDQTLHRAALAYLSDFTIQEPVMRANGMPWATPGMNTASLDHAIWWHRPVKADEWMLYVQESPSSGGGRGLSQGRLYSRDGILVASVAQEIMSRVPDGRR
ncbi:acyl-CoA thioesterase [Microbacterium halophytorum]|uniref:acyl-CoA thioesterase n=1 Tax=Microbacterium halophytorum TaxID=2067568 RepID=UPI001E595156|nr:acyl-CoA thioesterase II [Microbacterium halophytorum]